MTHALRTTAPPPRPDNTAPQLDPAPVRGLRLPVFRAITDKEPTPMPPYVTVVGIADRTRRHHRLTTVPDWDQRAPARQAPAVVAVLTPVRHHGEGGATVLVTVHLEAVRIEPDHRIIPIEVRYAGALVGTVNRSWQHHLGLALAYPAPPAVQLWHHAR